MASLRATSCARRRAMERTVVVDEVGLPPASVEDYNEMGRHVGPDEVAAVEAADLAFAAPDD
jgi:hypothetical protein